MTLYGVATAIAILVLLIACIEILYFCRLLTRVLPQLKLE